jgi:putative PIN family toxin of toxin-antitoxin system
MNDSGAVPSVVLDTNVLLDWLVFRDASVAHLARSIERGAIRWIITAPMAAELRSALTRPELVRWQPDTACVEAALERWAVLLSAPRLDPALHCPRCSDRSDQMFIDLAVGAAARWLVTRDRALLRLARTARPLAVAIVPPQRWPAP